MEAPKTDVVPSVEATLLSHDERSDPKPALTPPTSEDMDKRGERMSSELSELDSSDDEEEIEPDHYFDGGKIPVFKPVCETIVCRLGSSLSPNLLFVDMRPCEIDTANGEAHRQWTSFGASKSSSIRSTNTG